MRGDLMRTAPVGTPSPTCASHARSVRHARLASRAFPATIALLAVLSACASPSPSPSATQAVSGSPASPSPTTGATASPSPTAEPPLSLPIPATVDSRVVRYSVKSAVPGSGSGQVTITVASLATTRVKEIVLRWPSALDRIVFLSPFQPSSDRLGNALVQPWTKWVVGPGEQGEPAGTTSLGWGPLLPKATLTITLVATRRASGPVSFDLQFLAGEAILTNESGQPAEARVTIP